MKQSRGSIAIVLCLASVGCSAADPDAGGGRQHAVQPAAPGVGAPSVTAGSGDDGNFGNSNGAPPPPVEMPVTPPSTPAIRPKGRSTRTWSS